VKCIEHGHLMDEATAELMAKKDIWLSTQPFPDEMAEVFPAGSQERARFMEVFAGTDRTFELAKKYKIKTAFGTDILFSAALATRQENCWPSSCAGTRRQKPSRWRLVGVIEEGALADVLLVDGDPLSDISMLANPEKNLALIMKDGKVYKNALDPTMAFGGSR
jgi:imidazolonepropionase-like amidohydrolase